MELSIQERLKDLRVERGLTLEQLEEQVNLSKSALGSYEAKDFKDISHYAIIKLAKFYGVTADYLLGLSQTRNHPNADLADLRLSDDMIEQGLIDEVKEIYQKYQSFPTAMQGLGYKEVVEYLEGKISKDDMIEKIKQETRRYAKRQLTWFRKNKQTIWLDAQDKIQNNIKIILEG